LQKLSLESKNLQIAIKSRDPLLVKGVYDDDKMKWMCDKCPYLNKCEELRSLDQQQHIEIKSNVAKHSDINNGNGKEKNINRNTLISHLSDPGMNDLIIEGKIESIAEPRSVSTRAGITVQVADTIISDETGSVKLTLWDDQINSIKKGDNVTIEKGFTKEYLGEITLNVWKNGKLTRH
jgi:replication factor A1